MAERSDEVVRTTVEALKAIDCAGLNPQAGRHSASDVVEYQKSLARAAIARAALSTPVPEEGLTRGSASAAEASLRTDIENMPAEGIEFLAENKHGDWLRVKRYVAPFAGLRHHVISGRLGVRWEPARWCLLPSSHTRKDATNG